VVIEDHPMMREMIAATLARQYPDCVVDVAEDMRSGIVAASRLRSEDLVVLDLALPGAIGLSALRALRTKVPWVRVLVFSGADEGNLMAEARRVGACGYVPKAAAAPQFSQAVERVLRGEFAFPNEERTRAAANLTPTEIEVLQALDRGMSAGSRAELAQALGISTRVVKRRLSRIYAKLGVKSRVEALACAKRAGALRS
jgi:DNA-binding NarL/FixJ family response regulator